MRLTCPTACAACQAGAVVVVQSSRGSHQQHLIRTACALVNEVAVHYSPESNARECIHHCVLTDAGRIPLES